MCLGLSSLVIAAVALLVAAPSNAARPVDTDNDGVEDASDNCLLNPNPHQENTSYTSLLDDEGDVCDRSTINPIIEGTQKDAGFHVSTPFYRARVVPKRDFGVEFSAESGMFTAPNGGIGVPGADDSGVVTFTPANLSGVANAYKLSSAPSVQQSTWQSLVAEDLFTARRRPNIRFHFGSGANAVGLGLEVPIAEVPAGSDLAFEIALALPQGWSIDANELGAQGIGRLTLKDGSGVAKIRLSAVQLGAFGHETKLEDNANFFGLQRLTEELNATPLDATAGPADLVGSRRLLDDEGNPLMPDEAALVQTSYTLMENQADSDLGVTQVAGNVITLVAPAAFIGRNRATSSLMGVGIGVSSLTDPSFGAGKTVYGRHIVNFDEEVVVSGDAVTVEFEQVIGTFDGQPVPYDLFPNQGGTAAIEDWARQQQTGFGAVTMLMTGNSTFRFADTSGDCSDLNGGAGVGIGPGGRVGPNHPCLQTDPIDRPTNTGRCEAGLVMRGWFSADDRHPAPGERVPDEDTEQDLLTVEGSMGGLGCVDSDCYVEEFHHIGKHDPNVTDEIAQHAKVGLGCSAASGVRISRNPSDGKIVSNVPLDLNGCSEEDVGSGLCQPILAGAPDYPPQPPGTGICNLTADRVQLIGIAAGASWNACTDLTLPSGTGVALAMEYGEGRIGPKALNAATGACEAIIVPDPGASVIEGFQVGVAFGGGANVDGATGEPLSADSLNAVPPNQYCIDKFVVEKTEVGMAVGGNVDVEVSRCTIGETQFGSVAVGAGGANEVDPTSLVSGGYPGCREVENGDGKSCATVAEELACPSCRKNDENFLAVAAGGLSAPTRLEISQCVLGLDDQGNVVSGMNPALPDLDLDPTLTATRLGLTIAGRDAGPAAVPIQVGKGPDTIANADLLTIILDGNNIGLKDDSNGNGQASIYFDNKDSLGASQVNVNAEDNCYKLGSTGTGLDCAASSVLATASNDQALLDLNQEAEDGAASLAKPAGGDLDSPFKFYSSEPTGTPNPLPPIEVHDAFFGSWTVMTPIRPLDLGVPVDKDGEGIANTEAHLNCHEIREEQATEDQDVSLSTQFGVHDLRLVNATSLCLAATRDGVGSAEGQNAYVCYQRGDAPDAPEVQVELEDDLEGFARLMRAKPPPVAGCNPVSVPALNIVAAPEDAGADHLACFQLSDVAGEPAFEPKIAVMADALTAIGAEDTVDVVRARMLCERATASCSTCP
jgi:hypothetical protein